MFSAPSSRKEASAKSVYVDPNGICYSETEVEKNLVNSPCSKYFLCVFHRDFSGQDGGTSEESSHGILALQFILLMEEIPNQLRLVVYPIIDRVLYIPGGCLGFLPSTVLYVH